MTAAPADITCGQLADQGATPPGAARPARRRSIVTCTGLAPAQSYILASLDSDLLISEIVDAPKLGGVHLPTAALG